MTEEAFTRRFAQAERRTQVEKPVDFPYTEQPVAEPTPTAPQATSVSDPFALNQDASAKIPPVEEKKPETPAGEGDGDFLEDLLSGKTPK